MKELPDPVGFRLKNTLLKNSPLYVLGQFRTGGELVEFTDTLATGANGDFGFGSACVPHTLMELALDPSRFTTAEPRSGDSGLLTVRTFKASPVPIMIKSGFSNLFKLIAPGTEQLKG